MLFGSSKKSKKATAEAPAAPSSSSIDATKDAILATYNALLQSTGSEDSEEYLDPDLLTMEHIGKLCEQLNVDPSADVRVLVMLWRLGAVSTPGCITKTEFIAGFRKLRVSSLAELRSQLPSFDPGFLEKTEFREFYKFVFQFSREGTNKTLEKEVAIALLPIVLDVHRAPHLTLFLQFLEGTTHAKITLDQWDSFLQFNGSINLNLSNHDDDGAWPLLLDEYVDWRRIQKASK